MPMTRECNCDWDELPDDQKTICRNRCQELLQRGIISYCKDDKKPIYGWKQVAKEIRIITGRPGLTPRTIQYWDRVVPIPRIPGCKGMGVYYGELKKYVTGKKKGDSNV